MNDHSCDLRLRNGSRSNRLKSGTGGVCFGHTFYPEIVPARGSKAPDVALSHSIDPLWHDLIVRAGVPPSHSDSPEPIPFGYFPL
jgi:hypothetical protein